MADNEISKRLPVLAPPTSGCCFMLIMLSSIWPMLDRKTLHSAIRRESGAGKPYWRLSPTAVPIREMSPSQNPQNRQQSKFVSPEQFLFGADH